MPVDSSIYNRIQTPNIFGAYFDGLDQHKQQKAQEQKAAYEKEDRERQKKVFDQDQQMRTIDMIGRIAPNIKDQTSYDAGIRELAQNGIDVSQMPKAYDPGLVNRYASMAMSAKDRLAQQNQEREFKLREEDMKLKYAQRNDQKSEAKKEREGKQLESDVQNLSKSLSGTQDLQSAIGEVENELGAPLGEFSTDGGNLKRNGKTVDLPGVSIPLLGRVSAYDEKARNLASRIGKVFNVTLKDRSGAAVTNTELERLKDEFGSGKYNSETELIGALQAYNKALNKEMQNREAGFRPEVVATYADRGGGTSKKITEPNQERDVADYAKKHGISYQEALNVKNARTSQAKR